VILATNTNTSTGTTYATDPYAGNVVSLLHFDGNFTDETGKSWTQNGGIGTNGTQSKFGGGAIYFDGVDDYMTATHSDFNSGNGAISLDFHFYLEQISANKRLVVWSADSSHFGIYTNASNKLEIGWFGIDGISGATTLSTNKWYHLYIYNTSTASYLYLDGVLEMTYLRNMFPQATTTTFYLGYDPAFPAGFQREYIDELRITK